MPTTSPIQIRPRDPKKRRLWKIEAAKRDKPLAHLIEDAMDEYLSRHP